MVGGENWIKQNKNFRNCSEKRCILYVFQSFAKQLVALRWLPIETHLELPGGVRLSNESMSQGRQVRSATSFQKLKITEWSVWKGTQTDKRAEAATDSVIPGQCWGEKRAYVQAYIGERQVKDTLTEEKCVWLETQMHTTVHTVFLTFLIDTVTLTLASPLFLSLLTLICLPDVSVQC